jgi:ATP-binding cassette subfamily C protein LapB
MAKIAGDKMPCVAALEDGRALVLLAGDGKTLTYSIGQTMRTAKLEDLKSFGLVTLYTLKALNTASSSQMAGDWPGFYAVAWRFLSGQERQLLGLTALCAALGYFLLLAVPLFTMAVYDRVIPHMAFETLWALAIGVGLALGLDLALRHVRLKLQDASALSLTTYLQGLMLRQLFAAKGGAERDATAMQQGLREIEGLGQLMPNVIVSLAIDLPFFLLLLVFVGTLGGPVMLAPLLGVVLIAIVQALTFRQAARSNSALYKDSQRKYGLVLDAVENLERVKALRATSYLLRRWDKLSVLTARTGHESRHLAGFIAQSNMIIVQAIIVLVLIIGVYQVAASTMTMGALIATILIVGRAVAPVSAAVVSTMRLLHMRGTISHLDQAMAGAVESGNRVDGVMPKPYFQFENVSLHYLGAPRPALEGINLKLKPEEKVAVIGRSGSGKSSLLKLMARLETPTSGLLRLGDYNIEQYLPDTVRTVAAYSGQNPQLFAGDVWHNLTLGLQNVDPQRVEALCRITGVQRFLADHPEGYGLKLGPRGEGLSGGEQQAVALTRTLLSEAPLLLLDEPTAAFDTQGEEEFVAAMQEHLQGKSLLLATHRLPVLKLVDRVILMDKGRILEDGPKDEVIAKLVRRA